jgi:hypothetical protein
MKVFSALLLARPYGGSSYIPIGIVGYVLKQDRKDRLLRRKGERDGIYNHKVYGT